MTTMIRVENLSKRYRIGAREEMPRTAVEAAKRFVKSPLDNLRNLSNLTNMDHEAENTIWALKDVSFDVQEGDVVGIVGRNGAGKSTLLKILSRITRPTEGKVRLHGRVGSLLEVGTGFHPELTGRENVYLNGTILGMSKSEIDHKFDEIVDFSGVEKFIDTPIKRFSSGMQVRLAFAVAAHLEPEILIVDEVLAVGDLRFQEKSLKKMNDVSKSGRTVLFVSHNLIAIQQLTRRCLYLHDGKLVNYGPTDDIVNQYISEASVGASMANVDLDAYRYRPENRYETYIRNIFVNQKPVRSEVIMGDEIEIQIEIHAADNVGQITNNILIKDRQGRHVVFLSSTDQNHIMHIRKGVNVIGITLRNLILGPGEYIATTGIRYKDMDELIDRIEDIPLCVVHNNNQYFGNRPWGIVHTNDATWQQVEPVRS